jgi:hypothetical protein
MATPKLKAFRFRPVDQENLDRFRARLQALTPMVTINDTDVVRSALALASAVADRPADLSRVQKEVAASTPSPQPRTGRIGRPPKRPAPPPPPDAASLFYQAGEDAAPVGDLRLEDIVEAATPEPEPAVALVYEPDTGAAPPSKADERAAQLAEHRRRAIELADQGLTAPAIVRALKADGVETSERSVQRWLAADRQAKARRGGKRVLVPGRVREPAT